METIRAKSRCIFRHEGRVLLYESYDPSKNQHYLTPIGGSIHFGETSEKAARREILEEIGAEAHSFQLLGVLENFFTFNGIKGHEIVFIYEAQFVDEALYQKNEFLFRESDGSEFIAKWFSRDQITSQNLIVYPDGIENMIFV